MTSKDGNDTLPIPAFSEELPIDSTVDEDFIPTSQPQGFVSPKCAEDSQLALPNTYEEGKDSGLMSNSDLLLSVIEDTIPTGSMLDPLMDKDRSSDFIPETETKKKKINYSNEETACKKRLRDNFVKCSEDMFGSENWEREISKMPESPALEADNVSVIADTPMRIPEDIHKGRNMESEMSKSIATREICPESITEIILNDSAETVELDTSENASWLNKGERLKGKIYGEKTDVSSSFGSDVIRCEKDESLGVDGSSGLILEPAESSFSCSNVPSEKLFGFGTGTQKMYLNETMEDKVESPNGLQGKREESTLGSTLPIVPKFSKDLTGFITELEVSKSTSVTFKQEKPKSLMKESRSSPEVSPSHLETRTINFNLSINCLVTINTKTKDIHQKLILNVNELSKPKPKAACVEYNSDNASDKSKRYSTSSSGSVYSDKMGFPFALPKRVSAVSDQTDGSDSSEEGFLKKAVDAKKILERMPWSNEYLLPLKMDELMTVSIENSNFLPRPSNKPFTSPRNVKHLNCNGLSHVEDVLESSSSDQTSINNLDLRTEKESLEKDNTPGGKITGGDGEEVKNNDGQENAEGPAVPENQPENLEQIEEGVEKGEPSGDNQRDTGNNDVDDGAIQFSDGLPIFARWTDKRYYPGILSGTPKNERWEIKFDDGTTKTVREDFILPCKWLKVGELVFALVDDKYVSGQITHIQRGEIEKYTVELDSESRQVTVPASDLCLTEVMAGIVREKFKRFLTNTPRGKGSSDIDFDNVLTGKRIREQRTPLRVATGQTVSSGSKKKSSARGKKEEAETVKAGEQILKETPQKQTTQWKDSSKKTGGLQSENGHLVVDKVISGDSPSGAEAAETPVRGIKETRGKAKPRSLCYETEEVQSGMGRGGNWLAPDGTPIPGFSGVKFRRKMGSAETAISVKKLDLGVVEEEKDDPLEEGTRKEKTPANGSKVNTEEELSSKGGTSLERKKGSRKSKLNDLEESREKEDTSKKKGKKRKK